MIHLYIMPVATGPYGPWQSVRYAAYAPAGVRWSMMDYGWEPLCICAADVDSTQDAAITAHADVIALPDDLDTTIGAALTVARSRLRAMNIPAGWLTAGTTYREAVRVVAAVCQLMQRLKKYENVRLFASVDLSMLWQDVPATWRERLRNVVEAAGYSTDGLTAASSIEDILQSLCEQAKDKAIAVGLMTV